MKKPNLFFAGVFVLMSTVCFVSCQKDDQGDEISKKGLIPLKKGNTWSYKVYRSGEVVDTISYLIGDYVTIDSKSGFEFLSIEDSFHTRALVDNDDEGNFLSLGIYSDIDTLFIPSIRYKINAFQGDIWNYELISYNENGVIKSTEIPMECINIDTTITVPSGDFNCKVFEWSPNSGDDTFKDYVSGNIGIIKSEHFEGNRLFNYNVLFDYKISE